MGGTCGGWGGGDDTQNLTVSAQNRCLWNRIGGPSGGRRQETEGWVKKWHFGVCVEGQNLFWGDSAFISGCPQSSRTEMWEWGRGGIKRKKWGEEMGGNGGG